MAVEYECGQVPVIDFLLLKDAHLKDHNDRGSTYIQLRKACEEWGCFLIENHGIKEEITREMDSAVRDEVFKLPKEIKQRNKLPRNELGYIHSVPAVPFYESLGILGALDPMVIQTFTHYLWPQRNPKIRKVIQTYASCMEELTINVIQAILWSFGVDKFDTSEFWGLLRMNFFDVPPNDRGGMSTHVDHNCIVVLYEDGSGGLAVKSKSGMWADVKFVENSFVVIMGDCFKALTNGRTHNVTHRVIMDRCGDRKCRLSMPFFYDFSLEATVNALARFVDDHHPRLYKPFIYGEYRKFYIESQKIKIKKGDGVGSETARQANLESSAGIKKFTSISG